MKKILVADDSITIQKIVAMAFEKEEIIVEGVSNGEEAFNKIESFKPNIVLADVDMPGLTGFELSKKIKEDQRLNFIKVLLLASDFEDFNENLFKNSGADDHISKPFKSDDIIKKVNDLLSKNSSTSTVKTTELKTDVDKGIESNETVIELSTENLIEEIDSTIELTSADLEAATAPDTTKPLPNEEVTGEAKEDDLDKMIKDIESLKEATEPAETDNNEFGEVDPTREDEIGDELDTTFQEIVKFGLGKETDATPSFNKEIINNSPDVDIIIPEPEDLLEKMTPSAMVEKQGASGPNLIQDSLSYFSQISHDPKIRQAEPSHQAKQLKDLSRTSDTEDDTVVSKHIRQIIKNSLDNTLEKEITELSNSITQSVREVVREITPKIAREIIKEEIDKIKNL